GPLVLCSHLPMVLISIRTMPQCRTQINPLSCPSKRFPACKMARKPRSKRFLARFKACLSTFREILWLISLLNGKFYGYIHPLIAQFLGFSLQESQPSKPTFGGANGTIHANICRGQRTI